jgi:hypothetical protein
MIIMMNRVEIESQLPNGYKLISPDYGVQNTKLYIECGNGHHWRTARLSNILRGIRCPECTKNVYTTLDPEASKAKFLAKGWEVAGEYVGAWVNTKFRCVVCGFEVMRLPANFKGGCSNCKTKDIITNYGNIIDNILRNEQLSYTLRRIFKRGKKFIAEFSLPNGLIYTNSVKNFTIRGQRWCGDYGNKKLEQTTVFRAIVAAGYSIAPGQVYKNSALPISVVCPKGHPSQLSFNNFSRGLKTRGSPPCLDCAGTRSLLPEEIIKRAAKHNLEVVNPEVYENQDTILTFRCKVHGEHQKQAALVSDYGCQQCALASSSSKAEHQISDWLCSLGVNVEQNVMGLIGNKEIDIYLPDYKVGIEYCGLWWHSTVVKPDTNYHLKKWELAQKAGIKLLTIFEDEWTHDQDQTERLILSKLGKLEVCEGPYQVSTNYDSPNINVGLFCGSDPLLTWCLTDNRTSLKIERIVGRAQVNDAGIRLLFSKVAELAQSRGYRKIVGETDRRVSTGKLFQKLGFGRTGQSEPRSHAITGNRIVPMPKDVESQRRCNYIYDCGHDHWSYSLL